MRYIVTIIFYRSFVRLEARAQVSSMRCVGRKHWKLMSPPILIDRACCLDRGEWIAGWIDAEWAVVDKNGMRNYTELRKR
jgi:hypothetical protein